MVKKALTAFLISEQLIQLDRRKKRRQVNSNVMLFDTFIS
jgi:hypothetical protein